MITKDILMTLSDYEVHTMLAHYLELATDLESCAPGYKLIEKLKSDILKLFTRIPESTYNTYCDGECFQVPCKKIKDKFYYYENGTVFADGQYLFDLPTWISEDAYVTKTVNDSILKIVESREDKENVETMAAKEVKKVRNRFNGILNRQHFLFIKYQMCKHLNKKFHVPKKFKIKGKPFYENAKVLEKILTGPKLTDSTFRALNNSFGYQDCCDLYHWLSSLFNYFTSTYSSTVSTTNIRLRIPMATESQLEQMLEVHNVVINPDRERYWITERIYREQYYSLTLEPLKLNVGKVEEYYYSGSCIDIVRFAKIAEALYNKEEVSQDFKDFLVVMGLVEKKEEKPVEG